MGRNVIAIDSAGRIVLPKPLRNRLHLRGGDRLAVEDNGETIELRPVRPPVALKKVNGVLVVAADAVTERVSDLIAESREERLNRVAGSGSENCA